MKKIDKLVQMVHNQDWKAAIFLAASFPDLGEEKDDIKRAASAFLSPEFYRGLKMSPDELIEKGKNAILSRYSQRI